MIRWTALVTSLLMVVSFAMFALDQARSASTDSQNQIAGNPQADQAGQYIAPHPHHNAVRRAIDDAASSLESPFQSLGVHSSHQWVGHGALLVLGLLLYGVGLGYLSRWLSATATPLRRHRGPDHGPTDQAFAG